MFEVTTEGPSRKRRTGMWKEVAQAAQDNKGSWVKVDGEAVSTASAIRRGAYSAFRPASAYEVRSANTRPGDNGKGPISDIYIRYIGTPTNPIMK